MISRYYVLCLQLVVCLPALSTHPNVIITSAGVRQYMKQYMSEAKVNLYHKPEFSKTKNPSSSKNLLQLLYY